MQAVRYGRGEVAREAFQVGASLATASGAEFAAGRPPEVDPFEDRGSST